LIRPRPEIAVGRNDGQQQDSEPQRMARDRRERVSLEASERRFRSVQKVSSGFVAWRAAFWLGLCLAPHKNATPMPGVRIDKANTYPSDARHVDAPGADGAGQRGGTRVSSGLRHFRKLERAPRRAKDARARVALECADPRRVGCTIHPEADEDTALRALLLLLERRLADTHDRHGYSQCARRPYARALRPASAARRRERPAPCL